MGPAADVIGMVDGDETYAMYRAHRTGPSIHFCSAPRASIRDGATAAQEKQYPRALLLFARGRQPCKDDGSSFTGACWMWNPWDFQLTGDRVRGWRDTPPRDDG